jgi:hypothetical protein
MQTITIDILNEKALKLLYDLELLQLIRLRRKTHHAPVNKKWAEKYKGTMQKQSIEEIENQLNCLRNSWE